MAVHSASKFHEIPDSLWERIELVLPIYKTSCKGGRPRLPLRQVVNGILYVLYTGCQWKAMPRQGNRILFAGKSCEDVCQQVVIPARLKSFAAEAAF